jgi:Protein of unknown function (DUF1353)
MMQRRAFLITGAATASTALAGCDVLPGAKKPTTPPTVSSSNSFKGSVKSEWLTAARPNDSFRDMKLLDTFGFIDPSGTHWDVPTGYITNGASIPWGLWNIIGGPYDGPYRDAAVIHDYYCEKKLRPWEKTHRMYYDAALARGTSDSIASAMYAGLQLGGPRWTLAEAPTGIRRADMLFGLIPAAHAQTATKVDPGLTNRGAPTTDAHKKAMEELQAWIIKDKPTPEQIAKRVEEVRKQLGLPTK